MPLFDKSNAPATKLFFATDVHGSERTWRKFINAGDSDVLAVLPRGGDGPVQACEGEVVQLDAHHTMASLGISTPTPWHTPREGTENEVAVGIEKLLTSIPD